jgi:HlyD family secretion protein
MKTKRKRWLIALLVMVLGASGHFAWQELRGDNLPAGFASGNGRIEAVEIDIGTKTPGRIREILTREGDSLT